MAMERLKGQGWLRVIASTDTVSSVQFHEPSDPVEGGTDTSKVLHPHIEVEVKRYREHASRQIRYFKVCKAISPYLFFTEFDWDRPCRGFRDWKLAMQDFYNNDPDKNLDAFRVQTTNLLKYRCYAYLDPGTGLWERVRVMKYDTKTKHAEIYLYEHNEFRIVSRTSFMELNPEFTSWTSQSFPTHLLNIQPAHNAQFWSPAACKFFKELVEGKSFYAVIIARTSVKFPEGFPEHVEYLGALMVQRFPKKRITIQGELVRAGFAEPTGPLGGYEELLEIAGGKIGRFDVNSFQNEPESSINTPGTKQPKPPPTADEIKSELAKLMAKAVIMRQTLTSEGPIDSSYEFVPDMMKRQQSPPDNFLHLPDIYKHGLCQVRFSHILCPSTLYVQLENHVDELREMESALALVVDRNEPIPFEECIAGLEIACLVQVDRFREPAYVRAVVRHVLPGVKILKVILIDYGSDISVKNTLSRHLPPHFAKIPGFAFRMHLDSPMVVPTGGRKWSSDAADTFRRYMSAWNLQTPMYYAWKPGKASLIPLDDYNQELYWDPALHKWSCAEVRSSPLNTVVNSLHESVLLRNLYTSLGLDVVYELVAEDERSDYSFDSLSEVLCECGFAIRLMPIKTIWGQHHSIVTTILEDDYKPGQIELCASATRR